MQLPTAKTPHNSGDLGNRYSSGGADNHAKSNDCAKTSKTDNSAASKDFYTSNKFDRSDKRAQKSAAAAAAAGAGAGEGARSPFTSLLQPAEAGRAWYPFTAIVDLFDALPTELAHNRIGRSQQERISASYGLRYCEVKEAWIGQNYNQDSHLHADMKLIQAITDYFVHRGMLFYQVKWLNDVKLSWVHIRDLVQYRWFQPRMYGEPLPNVPYFCYQALSKFNSEHGINLHSYQYFSVPHPISSAAIDRYYEHRIERQPGIVRRGYVYHRIQEILDCTTYGHHGNTFCLVKWSDRVHPSWVRYEQVKQTHAFSVYLTHHWMNCQWMAPGWQAMRWASEGLETVEAFKIRTSVDAGLTHFPVM